ncbi:hypothetical protein [Pseudomonas sp.]|uniref:hypothetical protein n=1 Tax=Pseudomonas sp. TaxID=306 RepID=UPI003FD899AF
MLNITKSPSETKPKKSPHLAMTHQELQGGAANGRNVSLLMKSGGEFSEEVQKALVALGYDTNHSLVKAFYSQVRDQLTDEIKEMFCDEDDWCYVEDFDESQAIFCVEGELYSVKYTVGKDGEYVVEDTATAVTTMVSYVPDEDEVLLSEDAEEKLEDGTYKLVKKALENTESYKRILTIVKAKSIAATLPITPLVIKKQNLKDTPLKEEIEKAVAAVETLLKAQILAQTKALEKASLRIKELEQTAITKSRKELLSSVEEDVVKLDALVKSLETLGDEAFAVVAATMVEKAAVVEQSGLFKQTSVHMKVEEPTEGSFDAMMKAKYAAK